MARPRAVTVADLYWFGRLIGNSDMHRATWASTSSMPVCWSWRPPAPDRAGQLPHIAWAAEVAARFWHEVANSGFVRDEALRDMAPANRDVVARFGKTFASGLRP